MNNVLLPSAAVLVVVAGGWLAFEVRRAWWREPLQPPDAQASSDPAQPADDLSGQVQALIEAISELRTVVETMRVEHEPRASRVPTIGLASNVRNRSASAGGADQY